MNYKIGDRIFFEYVSDGTIGEAIVINLEPRSYTNAKTGEVINFNMLRTGKYTMIEDYNCLPENDSRVIEYKETHEDPRKFINKFKVFLKENKFDISQGPIRDYLYELLTNK